MTAPRRITRSKVNRESQRARTQRTLEILERLQDEYPNSKCALIHRNPLELLVATILSAQCTDKRVNMVTPSLFSRFPTAAAFAEADLGELEEMVRSTGFFRNKARSLKSLGLSLVADHGGEVPKTMKELNKLPGVGRKTANVVLGNAFGIDEGVVVDTHVGRLSRLLGLSEQKAAEKVELDLMTLVPTASWTLWAHLLIDHGRAVCKARKPDCQNCVLADLCPSAEI
jgi:endonuclease-3